MSLPLVYSATGAELPYVYFTGSPLNGHAPLVVQFTNYTNPAAVAALDSPVWLWEFGDGEISSEFSPQHTYMLPGKYSVKCTLMAEGRKSRRKRLKYVGVKPAVDKGLVSWSTYFGGANGSTDTWDTAVDGDGNLVVAGGTYADDLPTTTGAYDKSYNGDYDIFVAKFSAVDGTLMWATYIGDDAYQDAEGLLVLDSGEIIVSGYSRDAFPAPSTTTIGTGFADTGNIVMLSLSADGATINKTLFFGGESGETSWERNRVGLDSVGNFVITGITSSTQFPVTSGAYQTQKAAYNDVFVAKVSSDLDEILWATYLGGAESEMGKSVAIDADEAVYVTGSTYSGDFPTTEGAYDRAHGGDRDGFVTKLTADGSALVYSTLIGGSSRDWLWDIAITDDKEAIVSGFSHSTDLALPPGGYRTRHHGVSDILVCKLSADGSALTAATFLGGKGDDFSVGMAIDGAGNVWLSGGTTSTYFPRTTPTFQSKFQGGAVDCFVSALDSSLGTLVFSTFLGGRGYDLDGHISVDADGNPLVAGITDSPDFPTTAGAPQPDYPGAQSIFVTKFDVQALK
jgi:PKD repeat protein